ncbi:hypothetical protein PI124_g21514 [Phytophthora idaei]|nr:hypothetical protein PI125_g23196 [Phytophthora idaei]KAG3131675.1 hypothetical protein PI126_g19959 [Phytophthora idaei]KAG3233411.1 hypothetical protein PI124_g21514 [Phytophthora idaei]
MADISVAEKCNISLILDPMPVWMMIMASATLDDNSIGSFTSSQPISWTMMTLALRLWMRLDWCDAVRNQQ